MRALADHARACCQHEPVTYPGGGTSTGAGLILTITDGGATLRSTGTTTDCCPAAPLHAVPDRRLMGPPTDTPSPEHVVLLPAGPRHPALQPAHYADRCAAWLQVNVWFDLPGMHGVPLVETYQSYCIADIDTGSLTWRPAMLTCSQFPGRAYAGEVAEGIRSSCGVLARFDADAITAMVSDTSAAAGQHGSVWVQALSDSVQLLTSLSSQSPDNWLQMGWARRDSDGQFLLGVHQLDWRLAELGDS